MTSRAIERVEKAVAFIETLQAEATSPVERIDLADIRSDLDSALEKLQALQTYQDASDTNYSELWETRKRELEEFEQVRNAWIRTSIFTNLLQNTVRTE